METEPIEPRRLIERVVAGETAEHPGLVISLEADAYLPIVAGEATYVEQVDAQPALERREVLAARHRRSR